MVMSEAVQACIHTRDRSVARSMVSSSGAEVSGASEATTRSRSRSSRSRATWSGSSAAQMPGLAPKYRTVASWYYWAAVD